jgi:hypothetical protein
MVEINIIICTRGDKVNNIKKKFASYLHTYKKNYSKDDIDYIIDHFMDYMNNGDEQKDLLEQVKCAIGEMDDNSVYLKYFNYLKEHFDLSQDILEVSCGNYPALANLIDIHQRNVGKGGSIEAMDPLLVTTSCGNIRLRKEVFTRDTDLSRFSLVTAYYPCEATMSFVEACGEQDKDYSIALCGCIHDSSFNPLIGFYGMYFYDPYENWVNKVYKEAKDSLRGNRTVDIDYIDGLDTPIFLSKKKH